MAPLAVHALVDDLFFRAKIEATAASLRVPVRFARDPGELVSGLDDRPALVLVDLAHHGADPVGAIRSRLKAREPLPRVIAFGSHVDAGILTAARDAGADRVLARSAFSARLAEILGEASAP